MFQSSDKAEAATLIAVFKEGLSVAVIPTARQAASKTSFTRLVSFMVYPVIGGVNELIRTNEFL